MSSSSLVKRSSKLLARRLVRHALDGGMRVLAGPLFGVLTAGTAGALGAWASISSNAIKACASSMLRLSVAPSYPGVGLLWWSVAGSWVLFYGARQVALSRTRESELRHLTSTMLRSPNPSLLDSYPLLISRMRMTVRNTLRLFKTDPDPRHLEKAIRECVSLICTMTSLFPHGMHDACYRGNVMLLWRREHDAERQRFERVKDSLVAYPLSTFSEHSLAGALELIPELTGTNITDPQTPPPSAPPISLPVPHTLRSESGRFSTFPGAPSALLRGDLNVVPTIEDIEDFCATLMEHPETTRLEVIRYFREGDGKNIRSFLSYRIGGATDPVAVLNIDCDETHLLGREPQFYTSYRALLDPMVVMVEPLVRRYSTAIVIQSSALTS